MMHVGFSEVDITPKPGSQSPGGMQKRVLDEVKDPLKAVAMVIKSPDIAGALVGVDSLFIGEESVARARKAVAAKTEITADYVLVGASHTHSGGPIASVFGCDADPDYVNLVADKVAEAVISAWNSLHEAEVGFGTGLEPSIAFNRRFLMHNGKQVTHPGKGNPDIVKPAGPIDPSVGVLAARAPGKDGALLGLFVNFACHLTVGRGNGFSADYVYDLREALRRHYQRPDLPVGFLLGAAGDVTQVDNRRPGRESGPAWSEIFGMALGAEVAQTVARIEWSGNARVEAVRTSVAIPIRDEAEVKRQAPELGLGSAAEQVYEREHTLLAQEREAHPVIDCEVQAMRVGDLGIVTNGAEFFCQLGLDIKAASPFPTTWVVSLANQYIGYVATPSAYYAGGYEPRSARSAKLAPWAGQSLVEAALKALEEID